jgi:hypothetical protein
MIPDTRNGLPSMACVSAMQKAIRRGMEREAMEFAVELIHTSKAFHSMVCKRLEIISHEDIDTQANPAIVPFVATAVAQAMRMVRRGEAGRIADGHRQCDQVDGARPRAARATTSLRQSGCAPNSKASRRPFLTGRTISTHWQAASLAVASTTSAKRVRSWYRSQQHQTRTSRKTTGSGQSSSRARDGAGRSRRERTDAARPLSITACRQISISVAMLERTHVV